MKGARKLAALIRKGHTMIGETRGFYYDGECGCAIGAAIAAKGLSHDQWVENKYRDRSLECCDVASNILGIHPDLLREVSLKHYCGDPRLAIAAWLETLEPDDKAWATEQVRKLLEGTKGDSPARSGEPTEVK